MAVVCRHYVIGTPFWMSVMVIELQERVSGGRGRRAPLQPKQFSSRQLPATRRLSEATNTNIRQHLSMEEKKQHVVFFHPDLGIGGAERLLIDAAVGLQNRGHKVTVFTSYCDPNHCFDEARDGKQIPYCGTLLPMLMQR